MVFVDIVKNQIKTSTTPEALKKAADNKQKVIDSISNGVNTIKKAPSTVKKNWEETAPKEDPSIVNLGNDVTTKIETAKPSWSPLSTINNIITAPAPTEKEVNKQKLLDSLSGASNSMEQFLTKASTEPPEDLKETFSGSLLYGLTKLSASFGEGLLNGYQGARAGINGAIASQNAGDWTRNAAGATTAIAFAVPSALFSAAETAIGGKEAILVRALDTGIKSKDDLIVTPMYDYVKNNFEEGSSSAGFANTAIDLLKLGTDVAIYHRVFKAPSDIKKGIGKVSEVAQYGKEVISPAETKAAFLEIMSGEKSNARPKVIQYLEKTVNEMKIGEKSFEKVMEALDKPIELRIRKRNFNEWFKSFWEDKLPPEITEGTVIGEVLNQMKEPNYNVDQVFEGAMEAMGQNVGSFKENRLVNFKGKENPKNRPGIDTPAPLPKVITEESKSWKRGDKVSVTDSEGKTHEGEFLRISESRWGESKQAEPTLVLETKDGTLALPTKDVRDFTGPKAEVKPENALIEEAKKYKSAEEFVRAIKESPEKIPTTPEYQKYLKEQDAFVKQEKSIYAEMKAMRDKYAEKTINEVPPSDIAKYDDLQKELERVLSKKTLAKPPEGVLKTHIGEKGIESQLTDIWNKATKTDSLKAPQASLGTEALDSRSPYTQKELTGSEPFPSESSIKTQQKTPPSSQEISNRELSKMSSDAPEQSPKPQIGQSTGEPQSGKNQNNSYAKNVIGKSDLSSAIKKAAIQTKTSVKTTTRVFDAIKDFTLKGTEYFQDAEVRVKNLVNRSDVKVSDISDPYLKATLYPGRVSVKVEKGYADAEAIIKDMKDVADKFSATLSSIKKEVNDYLISQHAPERNSALGDGAAGITTKEAMLRVEEIKNSEHGPMIEKIANKALKLNEQTLDMLRDSGVISKELHTSLRSKYKHHVPLQRILDESQDIGAVMSGKGFDVRSSGIKKAKGSSREVDDILANILTNYEQAVLRSEKNVVDQASLAFVRENAESLKGLMEETKLPVVPVAKVTHKAQVFNEVMDKVKEIVDQYGGTVQRKLKTRGAFGSFAPATNRITTKFGSSKDTLLHEFGHMLDTKFGLKNSDFFNRETLVELREIADLRKSKPSYARKGEEKIAEFISVYFSDLANAKNLAPKTTAKFTAFLKDKPELRELVDTMKSRSRTEEQMSEIISARQQFTTDPTILSMKEDGKSVYIKIHDTNLAIALKGIGREKIPGILKPVRVITNLYSGLATRFNPEFAFPNKVRDLQETAIFMAAQKEIGFKGATKTIARDLMQQNTKAVIDFIRGKDTEGTRAYEEMKSLGGTTGGLGLSTKEQVKLNLKDIEDLMTSKTKNIGKNIIKYVDHWNTIFEDSTRLSVYRQSLAQGLSKERAAFLAKEASINFNRMGKGGPIINALYMFSNASIQGSAKMIRSMKNPKVLAAVTLTMLTSVGALNEWNDLVDPDWRNKVTKWDRLNGMPIMIPSSDGGAKYITIPVSWGLKPIKVVSDYVYDSASGQDVSWKNFIADTGSAMLQAFNPLGGTDLLSAITPTIGDLPLEITRNVSWNGNKIRPDFDKNAPADIQYFSSLGETRTGKIAISISEALQNKLSIAVSPANIKYAYDQLIGGAGKTVDRVFNLISGISSDEKLPLDEYPFLSRFYKQRSPEEVEAGKQSDTGDLKGILQEQSREKFKLKKNAEALDKELSGLSPEDANKRLKTIYESSPELYEKVKDVAEERKLGLTYTDKQVKSLGVDNGKRANYIWNETAKLKTPEEKAAYQQDLWNKKILTNEVAEQLKQLKEKGGTLESKLMAQANDAEDEKSMAEIASLYAKAFSVDPLTAIQTLFTSEQLKDVRGDAVIMKRMGIKESQAVKKKGGAGPTDKLDHTIPLELGGDNSESNLQIVTEAQWKSYTPVENWLGKKLIDESIDEKTAAKLITEFKQGKISFEEIKQEY
jgi:hypothetical protein